MTLTPKQEELLANLEKREKARRRFVKRVVWISLGALAFLMILGVFAWMRLCCGP